METTETTEATEPTETTEATTEPVEETKAEAPKEEAPKEEAPKEEAKPEDKEPNAPESYDFKNDEIAPEVKTAFGEVAKELDLSQENADKVLNKMIPVLQERADANLEKVRNEWLEASKNDKEIGGNNLEKNLGYAKKALTKFATDDLRNFLNETSLGNHPEVIRLMTRIGKSISEDGYIGGKSSGETAKPHTPNDREAIAQAFYPSK
jgi:hypothetical protein